MSDTEIKSAADLLKHAEGLIYENAFDDAERLAREALSLNPPKWDAGRAYKLIGICEGLKGNYREAIASMKQAVTVYPEYASGYYNLACLQAQLGDKGGMLHSLEQCIKFGLSECVYDYRPQILEDEDFEPFRADPDFIALCDRLPKDPLLRKVYQLLQDDEPGHDPYLAYQVGEEVLPQVSDKLAVLEAMEYALDSIVSDLDEHGEVNLELYGDGTQTIEFFRQQQQQVYERVRAVKRTGTRSYVFKIFRGY